MKENNNDSAEALTIFSSSFSYRYRLESKDEDLFLYGEELEGEKVTFQCRLTFSADKLDPVKDFARELAVSRTFPQMMVELAEENFSPATFWK